MEISPEVPAQFFDLPMAGFNMETLLNTWFIMALLFAMSWWVTRNLHRVPGRFQAAMEMFVEFFDGLCSDTLGEDYGRKYLPFIGSIFLFVTVSNMIGIIPNFLSWLGWPGFVCPTQDLNTPLGLALVVVFVVHISAIKIKGFQEWLWSFFEPAFPADYTAAKIVGGVVLVGGLVANYFTISAFIGSLGTSSVWFTGIAAGILAALTVLLIIYSFQRGQVPNVFMAPLNIVGEMGKSISHPFRLYGNIFGGFVITVVLSHLGRYAELLPALNLFFGLFIGVVQAFVFAMLALAYIAVQIV